jgi:hypothetical protein
MLEVGIKLGIATIIVLGLGGAGVMTLPMILGITFGLMFVR